MTKILEDILDEDTQTKVSLLTKVIGFFPNIFINIFNSFLLKDEDLANYYKKLENSSFLKEVKEIVTNSLNGKKRKDDTDQISHPNAVAKAVSKSFFRSYYVAFDVFFKNRYTFIEILNKINPLGSLIGLYAGINLYPIKLLLSAFKYNIEVSPFFLEYAISKVPLSLALLTLSLVITFSNFVT
ncbi:MAG: hypothetical protein QXR96_00335, partial [Candidatus Woesearchaeota archaeon]